MPKISQYPDGSPGQSTDEVVIRRGTQNYKIPLAQVGGGSGADGWANATGTWSYASPTTITVPSGATSIYQIGDKFKLTSNSVVLYGYIVGVSSTLLTVVGDTLTNFPFTNCAYSTASSPLGHPIWFNYAPGRAVSGGTAPTYTLVDSTRFSIEGRTVRVKFCWDNVAGGTAGVGVNPLIANLPVAGSFVDLNNESIGPGYSYENGGTIGIVNIAAKTSTTFYMYLGTGAPIAGQDQSSATRTMTGNITYEI